MSKYEERVWKLAVQDAEDAVLRVTPTLVGGKKEGESVEQYVIRARKEQDERLDYLEFIRKKLAACKVELKS